MFVWMILAVFMAALFAFNSAPRDDYYDIKNIPRAEAVAANLATMHAAAVNYVNDNNDPISYSSGSANGDVAAYLPVGYQNAYNVVSEIFCFQMIGDTKIQISCDDAGAKNYLISYVETPAKYTMVNGSGNRIPNRAMDKALSKTVRYAINIGYTKQVPAVAASGTGVAIGSVMGIQSSRGAFLHIPQGAQIAGKIGYNYLVYMTALTNTDVDLPAPI